MRLDNNRHWTMYLHWPCKKFSVFRPAWIFLVFLNKKSRFRSLFVFAFLLLSRRDHKYKVKTYCNQFWHKRKIKTKNKTMKIQRNRNLIHSPLRFFLLSFRHCRFFHEANCVNSQWPTDPSGNRNNRWPRLLCWNVGSVKSLSNRSPIGLTSGMVIIVSKRKSTIQWKNCRVNGWNNGNNDDTIMNLP